MLVRFTKNTPSAPADTLVCERPDGSTLQGTMPRQGILPHDAFHFVVETTLGWRDAFFGQIAAGAAHDPLRSWGHGPQRSLSKNSQVLAAAALVECLEQHETRTQRLAWPTLHGDGDARVRVRVRERGEDCQFGMHFR